MSQNGKLNYALYLGKSPFLIIQLLLSLVLAIELQNRISLTIQLLEPFTIDHRAVWMCSF
jgi:hypothetical protein